MSQPASRPVWRIVIETFLKSLRPRRFSGDLRGTDHFGNAFYEIPANPSIGKRRPQRYFVPPKTGDFQQEMAAEWEAWLRGRRSEPPTQEELERNLAIMEMKKKNAIAVDAKGGKMTPMDRGVETFPKRPDLEIVPGKRQ